MKSIGRLFLFGGLISIAILISGCTALSQSQQPDVTVQVSQSIDTMTFTPNHAKVGQHIRFHVATTDVSHQFEAKGTPFNDQDIVPGTPRDFDWTPDKAGTFHFADDTPGSKESADFTVDP
jgi:uncharacterized cupredoxin-like copper-binding protein